MIIFWLCVFHVSPIVVDLTEVSPLCQRASSPSHPQQIDLTHLGQRVRVREGAATNLVAFDVKIGTPKVVIEIHSSLLIWNKLRLIFVVEQGHFLVTNHHRSK